MEYRSFKDDEHFDRYIYLEKLDQMHPNDTDRQPLFFIISGNDDLFAKRNHIYDFKDNSINLDCLDSEKVDFSSSSKALIRLGFNLYGGYTDKYTSPVEIFCKLDENNHHIAKSAIDIKFGISKEVVDEESLEEDDEMEM
ncbi:hypothetical protein JYT99_02595 [bacterium AH-315-E09]|nr:hypothetical protein [bacterium AH-315-E09]